MVRPLWEIAEEINADWGSKVNFAAKPYLDAMSQMSHVNGSYGVESGRSVVLYFLSNASTWRGPVAKRVKAELKTLVK